MTTIHQSPPHITGQAGSEPALPLFATLPVALGGYTLTQLLGSHRDSDFYLARQTHVERHVVLEVLRPTTAGQGGQTSAQFLRLARTRAAANLPHTAPVLESATSPEGYPYICQELPAGTPLSAMPNEGQQLTVQQTCALIIAAEALYSACIQAGLAAGELAADMIFMNRAGEFSFLSPVQEGTPAEGAAAQQQRALATAIRPVQPRNVAGQTRIDTLLGWMQEGYDGEALNWDSAASTASLIAEQLSPEPLLQLNQPKRYDKGRVKRADKRRRRQHRTRLLLLLTAVATIIAMAVGGVFLAPESVPPIPALRGGCVHTRYADKIVMVAAHPVSIDEYRQFLDAWPSLDAARRGSLSQNLPPTESDPTPANWDAQLNRGDTSAPVTNVSYWQALMYARYRRASLPTATQLATARAEAGHPGLEEWTLDELPATPPYTKARLVLPAQSGASPLPERSPSARSPQRGFRICP